MKNTPLIPRRHLFGNPTASSAQLSPDGKWLTWLSPHEGVTNVWMAPVDNIAAAEPLTRVKDHSISSYGWTLDSCFVWFSRDNNGDENWHIFIIDLAQRKMRDLTPIDGISAEVEIQSPQAPDKIVIGINDRDKRWYDYYAVDVKTGNRDILWLNTQSFFIVRFDWDLKPRFARSAREDGGSICWRIDGEAVTHWLDIDYIDSGETSSLTFSADNKNCLMYTCLGRNTSAYSLIDWETGEKTILAEHPHYDIDRIIIHPQTKEILAASIKSLRKEWIFIAPEVCNDFTFLKNKLLGFDFDIVSQTNDNSRWVVNAYRAEQAHTFFLYDRSHGELVEILRSRPMLNGYKLSPMWPLNIKSRDGLNLLSYLTMPEHITALIPEKPLPTVLIVHGGPWMRDVYGYGSYHQWLANRGYAVLSVNYRGSVGFGKNFIFASEKEHAAKMHDDLIDAVNWVIDRGIADKNKVAIYGGSYGGYASFVAATFTPTVFCCCVSVVGFANLETFLESLPEAWSGSIEFFYRSYGDPRTAEGRVLLAERSPIHKVGNITKPMLIFHGENDVRCKVAESDAFVAAMQAKGIPVTYVTYPDEGHGFTKPKNEIAYIAMTEAFFARYLGGYFESFGSDLDRSSHEIRCGGEIFKAVQPE
ncbi:S9 family peptidase [Azospirillum sp. B510]|uniref:S9 family peptidase n=1 Tax=Azospirillum sp. (strain B510) TaxID=137722 RepID=UPI0002D841C4|nr:S9 family peptidase [Azospirillum sp. B510]